MVREMKGISMVESISSEVLSHSSIRLSISSSVCLIRGGRIAVSYTHLAPCPPLVLDTKTVDDPGNYGFSLVGAEGEDIAIKSVRQMCIRDRILK